MAGGGGGVSYRILVTGSRDWDDEATIAWELGVAVGTQISKTDVVLISGACPTGADAIAESLFRQYGLAVERHAADWSLGKRAGFLRNKEMVDSNPDICLAFIRNGSKGASMTRDLALKAGIPVITRER